MNIRPIDDRAVIQVGRASNKLASGIVLPDAAAEGEARKAGLRGTVVAVGPGRLLDHGDRVPPQVREGDRVLFTAFSGTDVEIDGEKYVIIREGDILGVEAR